MAPSGDRSGPGGDAEAIDLLRSVFDSERERPTDEGLRERKKRELRQHISDTATAMFIERGFDEVRVSQIAEACDVSDKTVFNYFPTKESLVFDREDHYARALASALSSRSPDITVTDAVIEILTEEVNRHFHQLAQAPHAGPALHMVGRFGLLIENSPALRGHLHSMTHRLTQVAARALAERTGSDPNDPEPQMAAAMVIALWRTMFVSIRRHPPSSIADLVSTRQAVLADIGRAGQVAQAGLASVSLERPQK